MQIIAADKVEFDVDDIVYHKVKPDTEGMITGILFKKQEISYLVIWAPDLNTSFHQAGELTTEKKL